MNQGLCPRGAVARGRKSTLDASSNRAEMNPPGLPSLVVSDVGLPCGTALTFLREIRQDSHLLNLLVSRLVWSEDEAIIRSLDVFSLLTYEVKPPFFADLLSLVHRFRRHCFSVNPGLEFCGQDRGLRP